MPQVSPADPCPGIAHDEPVGNGIDERVVLYRRNGSYLRAIGADYAEYYRSLFRSGLFPRLIEQDLVHETSLLEPPDSTGPLVLEQLAIEPVSFPHEWSSAMLADAAGACLDLQAALFSEGHCLSDSHPWNTVFSPGPKWVDITSVRTFDGTVASDSLDQFEATYLALLRLLGSDFGETARLAAAHAFHRFPSTISNAAPPRRVTRRLWRRVAESAISAQSGMVRSVRAEIALSTRKRVVETTPEQAVCRVGMLRDALAASRSLPRGGSWTTYSQAGLEAITVDEAATGRPAAARLQNAKFRSVYETLQSEKPGSSSLLDVACNRGIYSLFAAKMGYQVAATDIDEGALEAAYHESVTRQIPVAFLLNDLVAPVEASGLSHNPFQTFHQRITSDGVLCLALIHHLCLGRYRLSLPHFAGLLARVVRRFLVLEFVPPGDRHLLDNYAGSPRLGAYSAEAAREALAKYFRFEKSTPSFPEGRELWLLRKI